MALSVYDNQYHPVDYFTDRLWPVLYWPTLGAAPPTPVVPQEETWILGLSPAAIFGAALVEAGVVSSYGFGSDWPIFISFIPDEPDNAVVIFDTTPVNERRVHQGSFRRQYGLQLLIRAENAVDGRTKAGELYEEIITIRNRDLTVNGDDYRIKSAHYTTGIIHIPQLDDRRRHFFSMNMLSVILGLEDV
jgi:hypothetical protein